MFIYLTAVCLLSVATYGFKLKYPSNSIRRKNLQIFTNHFRQPLLLYKTTASNFKLQATSDIEDILPDEDDDSEDDDADDDLDDLIYESEIDDEDEDDDYYYDEDDEDDEDGDSLDGESKRASNIEKDEQVSWAARRTIRRKQSWEEKFLDDPLRSSHPTVDWEPEESRFAKLYIAVADIPGEAALRKREEAWTHHMQWVRRSSIVPTSDVETIWEYTQLSRDNMFPESQVIGIRSNETQNILDFFKSEPLSINKGVSSWQVFEMNEVEHFNTTWHLTDPFLFFAIRNKQCTVEKFAKASIESIEYHCAGAKGIRVSQYGQLKTLEGESKGIFVLFNAKTMKRAQKYIESDPLVRQKLLGSNVVKSVNCQDVSGLNHLMPRSFSQKDVLDSIHFMDPEDLLTIEVPDLVGLEDHSQKNLQALATLKELGISYRYQRWSFEERYGGEITSKTASDWNNIMAKAQKIRLQPGTPSSSSDNIIIGDNDESGFESITEE